MHTDLNLLARYHREGDAAAFQALVRMHADMVFAAARRITQDAALAEEVAQDTFVALARRGQEVRDSVAAWLHHVARQKAVNAIRGELRRRRREQDAAVLHDATEDSWQEIEPLVDEALDALPEDVRTLVIEHYLEQRTQQEIARRLGTSQATVSRQLERGLQLLRSDLQKRGVACGVGLGALLAAQTGEAAPAPLAASLHKLALSGVGSTSAAGVGVIALLSAMKLKLAVLLLAVGVLSLVGYDLASKDSRLERWQQPGDHSLALVKPVPPASSSGSLAVAANKKRLLAEAKAIWAKTKKLSPEELRRLFEQLYYTNTDPEKLWSTLRAAGFNLSREEFDRTLALHPGLRWYEERKAGNARGKLMQDLFLAWYRESPLEAVAWWAKVEAPTESTFFPVIASWIRSHPDAWAAFVEAAPDARLGDNARLWVEDLDDPGSIWAKAAALGVDLKTIKQGVDMLILSGASGDALLRLIMRCPDLKMRSEQIVGIAARLTDGQLLEAGRSGRFAGEGLGNVLRAMAGDPAASFREASDWVTKAAGGGGNEAQLARWTEEVAGRFYAQWLKVDAKAALQHAVRASNKELLDQFMKANAGSPALNEALMVESFTSPENRERALAAYYQARANGDPQAALQSIMSSAYVVDQVESAKEVLGHWTIRAAPDAAAWVSKLPAGENRNELAAAVASQWAEAEPAAALAFAQALGIGLSHGWGTGLAWGARNLPEDKLAGILAPLHEEPEYNRMLANLVGVRHPSEPLKAFQFLSKHAAPGWQTMIVDDTIHWLKNNDARTEDYALLLPTADLSQVDPQRVATVAQLLVQRLAKKDRLPEALDWTLKLPADFAPTARFESLAKLTYGNAQQKAAMEQWLQRAAISESERASLLRQVGQRGLAPVAAK